MSLQKIPDMKWTKDLSMVLTEFSKLDDFVMLQTNSCLKFALLEMEMKEFYKNGNGNAVAFQNLVTDGVYAGFIRKTASWGRIQVKAVPNSKLEKVVVVALDHGFTTKLKVEEIMELKPEFYSCARRSTKCNILFFEFARAIYVEEMKSILKSNIGEKFHVESNGLFDGVLQISLIQKETFFQKSGSTSGAFVF